MMRLDIRRRLLLAAAAAAVLALAAAAAGWWMFRPELPEPAAVRAAAYALLERIPAPVYFLAFAILPVLGVPLTLFYLTALPVLGRDNPALAVGLAWVAIALNMVVANLLTRGLLHPAIEWVIRRRNLSIPKLRRHNEWKVVLALRLSPLPWALQNFVLALGHARWRTYLFMSLPIQCGIGLAVMLVGESVLRGGLGYVLVAFSLLLAIHLVLDNLRKRLTREPDPTTR